MKKFNNISSKDYEKAINREKTIDKAIYICYLFIKKITYTLAKLMPLSKQVRKKTWLTQSL